MAIIAGLGALSLILGGLQLPSLRPALGEIYVPVIASALISVILGITCASLLESPLTVLERTAARDLRPARAFALAAVTLPAVALCAASALLHTDNGALLREPGHALAALGLSLLCLRRMPLPLAWCLVLAYALMCLVTGGALPSVSALFLFDATGTWPRFVAAVAVWVLGGLAYVFGAPRPVQVGEEHWWE